MDWTIRQLEDRDVGGFIPFLGQWITDRCVKTHFDWLYRGNPHGNAITWIAALSGNDQIVGCTSIFPRLMRLRGQQLMGSFGGDAFVDPNYRRRGIAQSLHEHCVSDMEKMEINCNFGFPLPANYRAFIRAGALAPCDFYTYRLPLRAEMFTQGPMSGVASKFLARILNPAVRLYVSQRVLRGQTESCNTKVIEQFDGRVNELFESVVRDFGICCARDKDYLNWRFTKNPFKTFTCVEFRNGSSLDGYAVLKLNTVSCNIVDFVCKDEDTVLKCLSALVRFVIDKDMLCVDLRLNPDGPYTSIFKRCGFFRRGKGRSLMALTIHDAEIDKQFNDARNWFLMPGDDDVA